MGKVVDVQRLDEAQERGIREGVERLRKERKRAITLAGGGPTVGLSIGALRRLAREPALDFHIWALSCIGAWLGIVYHQADKDPAIAGLVGTDRKLAEVNACEEFFRKLFRPDDVYSHYPTATAFGVDTVALCTAWAEYALDPKTYRQLFLPDAILEACEQLMGFATRPQSWTRSGFRDLQHNQIMAVNPMSRWLFAMAFKSNFAGWVALHDPDSAILRSIDFERLKAAGKPFLYHNAYNFEKHDLDLFCNIPHPQPAMQRNYRLGITSATLCACSALPYVESPVEVDGVPYCEGALVDTVNFRNLVHDNAALDEVWVSKIVNYRQVRRPENLYDALNNLIMLFAATTSDDDVKLFKFHLEATPHLRHVKVYEIEVDVDGEKGSFDWSWSNLDRSMVRGESGASLAIAENNRDLENIVRQDRGLPLIPQPVVRSTLAHWPAP